mmetsp:Transcript_26056/g.77664  ORF Transcript_26056/g.77664 Transcript_26056/m.77664 type:complete len:259 (-) Transcript_26056:210-986(-)
MVVAMAHAATAPEAEERAPPPRRRASTGSTLSAAAAPPAPPKSLTAMPSDDQASCIARRATEPPRRARRTRLRSRPRSSTTVGTTSQYTCSWSSDGAAAAATDQSARERRDHEASCEPRTKRLAAEATNPTVSAPLSRPSRRGGAQRAITASGAVRSAQRRERGAAPKAPPPASSLAFAIWATRVVSMSTRKVAETAAPPASPKAARPRLSKEGVPPGEASDVASMTRSATRSDSSSRKSQQSVSTAVAGRQPAGAVA